MKYIFKKHISKLLIISLSVFIFSFNAKKAEAIMTSPSVLAMCYTETNLVSAMANTPVFMGLYGMLNGFITADLGPVITPVLYAVFCEGDSITAAVQMLNKNEERIATQNINALNTATDKTFSMNNAMESARKEGANNLPPGSCDHAYITTKAGPAAVMASQESLYANSTLERYNTQSSTSTQNLSRNLNQTVATLSPLSIFGAGDISVGGTISDPNSGIRYIKNATNPIPYSPIPISQQRGPRGAEIMAKRNMDTADVSMSQKVLSDIMSLHAPVADVSSLVDSVIVTSPGGSAIMPLGNNTVAPQNRSMLSLLGAAVAGRYTNPIYMQQLYTLPTRQVVQNIATSQVVSLELEYQTLLAEQNQEAVLSLILARMANQKRF